MYENGEIVSENGFSQTNPNFNPSSISMGIELQQQLGLYTDHLGEMGHDLNKALPYDDQQNWGNETTYCFTTQNLEPQEENLQYIGIKNGHQPNFNTSSLSDFMSLYPPSMLAKSSFPFANQPLDQQNLSLLGGLLGPNVVYDSRDLFHQSLAQGSSSLIGEQWEYETGEGINNIGYNGKGITKAKEKIRRELVNDKFAALRKLVPNPTKSDKASVIADAINYIKELLMTKNELKIQVEKKRHGREQNKRQKIEKDAGDAKGCNVNSEANEPYNNGGTASLRSSWVQRKSRETEVDVRIVDDEATIKLAQKRKTTCLLLVTRVLDELQLDIRHVAGGLVGDNFSFLFNTKICEGSCVYASAIANKIIEVADRQYEAIQPGNNF